MFSQTVVMNRRCDPNTLEEETDHKKSRTDSMKRGKKRKKAGKKDKKRNKKKKDQRGKDRGKLSSLSIIPNLSNTSTMSRWDQPLLAQRIRGHFDTL